MTDPLHFGHEISSATNLTPRGLEMVTTKDCAARFIHKVVGYEEDLVFVDSFDAFIHKSQAPDLTKCFASSKQRMELFQASLKSLTRNMETRKIFKDLGVDITDPMRCDLNHVFRVATAAVEMRDGTGSLRACKNFARKCFKNANRQDTALGAVMSMIPSDIYGSVISGGIMTILAVANQHEKRKQAIEDALADIPKKIDRIKRMSDLHMKSPDLHHRADGVMVSIFVVLERIVDELTMSWKDKARSKISGAEDKVTQALSTLDESVSAFQEELDFCAEHRYGRMEEGINANGVKLEALNKEVQGITKVLNGYHRFLTSNPRFNTVDGGLLDTRVQAITQDEKANNGDRDEKRNTELPEKNKKIVDDWIESLGELDASPDSHIEECMRAGLGQLTQEDREKTYWILSSPEIKDWIQLDKSRILSITAENAPDGPLNLLSFTAVLLSKTLRKSDKLPVLSFFCGLRTNERRDRVLCGPMGVLSSLNAQLLKFCLNKRPLVDLSLLQRDNKHLMRKSIERPKYAAKLFHGILTLLEGLNDRDVVFVILDSWSDLLGGRSEADKVIEKLSQSIKSFPQLVIKILVLDALPSDSIDKLAHSVLYVPEEIDGWGNDVQVSEMEESNLTSINKFEDTRRQETVESDGSDSEESEGDWSD